MWAREEDTSERPAEFLTNLLDPSHEHKLVFDEWYEPSRKKKMGEAPPAPIVDGVGGGDSAGSGEVGAGGGGGDAAALHPTSSKSGLGNESTLIQSIDSSLHGGTVLLGTELHTGRPMT